MTRIGLFIELRKLTIFFVDPSIELKRRVSSIVTETLRQLIPFPELLFRDERREDRETT